MNCSVAERQEFHCTAEHPWAEEYRSRGNYRPIIHHGAREVGEQENGYLRGDMITLHCDFCGTTWKEELPQ